jgi:hypothetical protein
MLLELCSCPIEILLVLHPMLFSLSETDCKLYGTQIIGLEGFLPFGYDLLVSAAASGAEPLCEENLQKNLVRLQSHTFCL